MILIGELRDSETAETALQAAESGHLVLSTMHTIDAAETVRRMIEFFPAIKHNQIRAILAGVLCGVVSQRLLPKIGGGRVAAVEVMVNNKRIEELIREDRAEEIPSAIEDGAYFEMQSLPTALIDLVLGGQVDRETAANAATNRHDFLDPARARREGPRRRGRREGRRDAGVVEEEAAELPRLRLIAPGHEPGHAGGRAVSARLAAPPSRGFTIPEMLVVLAIMGIVTRRARPALRRRRRSRRSTSARRFEAQQEGRIALDTLRREIHCASAISSTQTGAGLAEPASIKITLGSYCSGAPTGGGDVTWCTGTVAPAATQLRRVTPALAVRRHVRRRRQRRPTS